MNGNCGGATAGAYVIGGRRGREREREERRRRDGAVKEFSKVIATKGRLRREGEGRESKIDRATEEYPITQRAASEGARVEIGNIFGIRGTTAAAAAPCATSVDSNYGAVSSTIICCIDYGARSSNSSTMEFVRWSTRLLLADEAEEEARLMTRINEITRLNGKEDEWRRRARSPH